MADRIPSVSASGSVALPNIPPTATMDRDFIARNQIVERYLAGKLPLKGAQDFERYCREHPELLDELRLTDQVHAGLRLLDAGGLALPWEEKPRRFWEKLPAFIGVAVLALVCAVLAIIAASRLSAQDAQLKSLQNTVATQPLNPAISTRSVTLIPSRTAPSRTDATVVGGEAQMADLRIDMSWSRFTAFRVTIDRVDQARALVLHNLLRDSNGHLRIAFNTSALGPGSYQLAIEGMTLQGDAIPQAWVTVGVRR